VVDSIPLPVQALDANSEGQFVFDVAQWLRDALMKRLADNDYGLSLLTSVSGVASAWRSVGCILQLYEVYGAALPFTDHFELGIIDFSTSEIKALLMDNGQSPAGFTAGSIFSRFLTNAPAQLIIGQGDYEIIGIYNTGAAQLCINRYNASGQGMEEISIPLAEGVVNLPAGPANFEEGALDDCATYSFLLRNNDNLPISETFTRVLRQQEPPVLQRIYWLNPYGFLDSYSFTGFLCRQSRWQRNLSGGGLRTDILQLSTGFESQEEASWLFEMLSSPWVFLQSGSDFIPLQPEDKEKVLEDVRVKMPVFSAAFRYV
jgi:hypothetical protein